MKQLFTLLLLITSSQLFSQTKYVKGHIVTQAGDTIVCFVPAASSFGDVVTIKKSEDGKEEKIPLATIRYLANGANVYENVAFEMDEEITHKLMCLKVKGKLNLYVEVVVVAKNSGFYTRGNGNTHEWRTKTYVVRKAGDAYWVDKDDFIETMTPLLSDNEDLVQKVTKGIYKYEDIETVVKKYDGIKEP